MDESNLQPFAFVLAVQDMDATASYFRDALGFAMQWADATDWRLVTRGKVRVMIGRCPGAKPAREIGDHSYFAYWDVRDVDAMHAELVSHGALVRSRPVDQPYGMREMVAATPDGHRMVIGQSLVKAG